MLVYQTLEKSANVGSTATARAGFTITAGAEEASNQIEPRQLRRDVDWQVCPRCGPYRVFQGMTEECCLAELGKALLFDLKHFVRCSRSRLLVGK